MDLGVSLLELVEEEDAARAGVDRPRQERGVVVADVSGRRSEQAGGGMPVGEFAHVDAEKRVVAAGQGVRQPLGEGGLADAGRPGKEEGSARPVPARVEAHPGDADGLGNGAYGLVLPEHVPGYRRLEARQSARLVESRLDDDVGDVAHRVEEAAPPPAPVSPAKTALAAARSSTSSALSGKRFIGR